MAGPYALIADDHPLTREGIAVATRAALPGVTLDAVGTIREAEAVIGNRRHPYRIVLLDYRLPDSQGFSGFLRLQHLSRDMPIAIVSAYHDRVIIEAARALGAAGFLSKTLPLDELARGVRAIVEGRSVFPPPEADDEIRLVKDLVASLSGAQLKVLLALADGKLNKQIASELDISEATVKTHMTAIFRKLSVGNRAQALLAVQPLLGELRRD